MLVTGNSTASFLPNTPLSYRFEVTNAAGAVIENAVVAGRRGHRRLTRSTAELDSEAPYQWRVRPEYQGTAGPWSARAAFVSPPSKGYLRGGELYDPLTNGKTIGTIVGPVTFIPGVGVRLESFGSRIVYEMPEPVEDGELSALVTNIATNTEGDKTKIFSMAQGYGDLTANPRRMTVEKRGDGPTGGIAWRFLTSGDDGVDTVGAERVVREFDPSRPTSSRPTGATASSTSASTKAASASATSTISASRTEASIGPSRTSCILAAARRVAAHRVRPCLAWSSARCGSRRVRVRRSPTSKNRHVPSGGRALVVRPPVFLYGSQRENF